MLTLYSRKMLFLLLEHLYLNSKCCGLEHTLTLCVLKPLLYDRGPQHNFYILTGILAIIASSSAAVLVEVCNLGKKAFPFLLFVSSYILPFVDQTEIMGPSR